MIKKNKYFERSKISEHKVREILKLFALGVNATRIAQSTNLNLNTVNRYLRLIRLKLVDVCAVSSPLDEPLADVVERLIFRKNPEYPRLVGLSLADGNIHTQLVSPRLAEQWQKYLKLPNEQQKKVFCLKNAEAYRGLIDLDHKRGYALSADGKVDGSGGGLGAIQNFRRMLYDRGGIPRSFCEGTALLHLKECEFVFNVGEDRAYGEMMRILRGRD